MRSPLHSTLSVFTRLAALLALCLLLSVSPVSALTQVHVVKSGESLWKIAQRYSTSVSTLKKLNGLRSSRIFSGQRIRVGKPLSEFLLPNGPYYHARPQKNSQVHRSYAEAPRFRPREDYRRAHALIEAYRADLEERLSNRRERPLSGWWIALDPGHGGRDPGAIVSNRDGRGRTIHVVEDEYVYDIAVRVFDQLVLYGARVEMTVISPNHTRRDNTPASATFVNEQNEVYNDARLNRSVSHGVRPGSDNIQQRVRIANRFFAGRRNTLFLSLHADNSPKRLKGPLVIYQKRKGRPDAASKRLAERVRRALDSRSASSQIGSRNLAVLRNNQARAEILVEIRNVAFVGDAWALRFHKTRSEDADRIVKGILDYVGS